MDGGRRLLRSLREASGAFAPARPALAGALGAYADGPRHDLARPLAPPPPIAPLRDRRARRWPHRFVAVARLHGFGGAMAILFLAGVGFLGAVQGGQYAQFVAEYGAASDVLARAAGLGLAAITISGTRELDEAEILQAADISPRSSLLFLNVDAVRERLKAIPLVRDASVRKLFPNRLIIDITEREPSALWQKDGALNLVAADGAPIAEVHDARFADLPFVVGDGANQRVAEFLRIVEAAGDMRVRVQAGVLVGRRRWNLKLSNGIEVKLPDAHPEIAATRLGRYARDAHILDKDLIYVDLRVPGRIYARLTEDAAAARYASLPKYKKRAIE